jgi:hypothetical protein
MKYFLSNFWQSMEDWNQWTDNPTRKEFDDLLEKMQKAPTAYVSHTYGKYRGLSSFGDTIRDLATSVPTFSQSLKIHTPRNINIR